MSYALRFADGRRPEQFDSLHAAIAAVALAHEHVEFSPEAEGLRVHIGELTLGHIVAANKVSN